MDVKPTCFICNKTIPSTNTSGGLSIKSWSLHNYYGLTGTTCLTYYDKVKHDDSGQPVNPKEYTYILLKLGLQHESV